MKISRIAVGIDLNPPSELVAKEALGLARRVGAELVLLHVAPVPDPPPPYKEWAEMAGAQRYREILKQRVAEAHDKMGQMRERLVGQGAEISLSIKDNNFPDWSLSAAALELNADLLVVGTHGRTGVEHFAAGSVAEGVVRRSDVPVIVARCNHEPLGQYQNILVAMDFSPAAKRALALAIAVADKQAKIDLIHAIDTDIGGQALADELEDYATDVANGLVSHYANANVRFQFHLEREKAKNAILNRAKGHDLIAMGTHGRRGFARLFLGSIATHTVRHAHCSVATIHPPAA